MTFEQRQHLRELRDRITRERLARELADVRLCAGCGCDLQSYSAGCLTCWNRERGRRRWREDEQYREQQNARRRERLRARRSARLTAASTS